MLHHHHRRRLRSLCFARFISRLWVCSLCNKQGFLNQEMDATQIARGISVIKDPSFTNSSENTMELRWNTTVLLTNTKNWFEFAKSFSFFWYCGGVKALASQIANQLEAVSFEPSTCWHQNLCIRQNKCA